MVDRLNERLHKIWVLVARWAAYDERLRVQTEERLALKAACRARGDMAPYYTKYPWESPEAVAAAEKRARQARKDAYNRMRAREHRRRNRR